MKNEFETLNECVKQCFKMASEYAIEGVNDNIGGPFGAAIIQLVDNKYKIITIERNSVIKQKDPTCHAEVNAIRKACKILENNDLSDCILVTTSKSCPMCLSAACWANIKTIYYGVDYSSATISNFRDEKIYNYIKGENPEIINEIQVKDDVCEKPFEVWNNKEDKIQY